MKILIVEDDFISRNLLKKMLVEMGHEVVETENGVQAWEILCREPLSIVISDWMMPEMDGIELCHKIRASNFKGYVYIIMLTAKDRKADLVDVFRAGADDYIPKPFDPEELRSRVMTGVRIVNLEHRHNVLANTLIESRNKLRIVLDSLNEEIVALDQGLKIVSMNQAFVEQVGCDPDSVVGHDFFDSNVVWPQLAFKNEIKFLVDEVFKSGNSNSKLVIGTDENGTESFRQISCLPIKDEKDKLFQIVVVSQDITEERKKSDKITTLNDRLMETSAQIEAKNSRLKEALARIEDTQTQMLQSEKMASIGQLAAGVAHEINNPTGFVSSNLKTLSGYQEDIAGLIRRYQALIVELENDKGEDNSKANLKASIEELKKYEKQIDIGFLMEDITDLISDCREGTDRIKKIVIDLKDFAHPGEDRIQSTDINNGLNSTLNVVNNELKYKATVHKDFGAIPNVKGVPQQLNQVFMNILVNAAQAIEMKGEIHIKTRTVDNNVEVTISDTGCGISKDNINKIFDPFFTTKDVGLGTGLGMNIAYNIIQKHNGSIDVSSQLGRGTTFTILLPAENGGAAE